MENVDFYKDWYINEFPIYEALALRIKELMVFLCKDSSIPYSLIETRAKSLKSFLNKINSGIRFDPKEMQDLAAARIVVPVQTDLAKLNEILKNNFVVNDRLSSDRGRALGVNKVGYKSIHLVASFPENRLQLAEYSKFRGYQFEIQIRTILQHAWAQIGHDRQYKSSKELPPEISRGFSLLAGLLEIADNEFGRITSSIDEYTEKILKTTSEGNLDIPINTISLKEYLRSKLGNVQNMKPIFGPNDDMGADAIEELEVFNITTLKALDKIISKKYLDYLENSPEYYSNFLGVIRQVLILKNPDEYFQKAWKSKWAWGGDDQQKLYRDLGINVDELSKKYQIDIHARSVKK